MPALFKLDPFNKENYILFQKLSRKPARLLVVYNSSVIALNLKHLGS